MTNGIADQIRKQLESGNMKSEDAIGFILQMVVQINQDIVKMHTSINAQLSDIRVTMHSQDTEIEKLSDKLDAEIKRRQDYERYTPSLIWIAANRTKTFVFMTLGFLFILTLLMSIASAAGLMAAIARFLGV